jgi:hypothetical protein
VGESTSGRIPVPRLLSREKTMWLSVIATVVAFVVILVWAFATQPLVNQLSALVLLVVVVLLLGFLGGRRTWLDTGRGAVVRDVWGLAPRAESWADAEVLRVRSNNAGTAALEVRGRGDRTSVYIGLVAVNVGGERSQRPEFLRALADQLERWAPDRGALARSLRAQADHIASGGAVRESPLARAHLRLAR